jgi:glycosyltransferase involved in cell wall biosynthesis
VKTTCLVNNYNYRRYLAEAVDSALAQTVPFDEIVIVDDGSTDGSLALINEKYARLAQVKVVAKENQGQLSAFNEGFRVATGDIVFFLDADDVYEPNYVEEALKVYRRSSTCDFLVVVSFKFRGDVNAAAPPGPSVPPGVEVDLGYSLILTLCRGDFMGAPTSCLSSRHQLLKRILPIPFLDDWRVRADDCLMFGSSLTGGRKYLLPQPLVRYRQHDANLFAGKRYDKFAEYRRMLAIDRLFSHFAARMAHDPARLPQFAHLEFRTIPRPTFLQFRHYVELTFAARMPTVRKLRIMKSMLRYFAFECRRDPGANAQ